MTLYLCVKAIHILAVISWMAGILYLPRLFVYHAGSAIGGDVDHTLQRMERNLLRYIMNPAMLVVFVSGGWLVTSIEGWQVAAWVHIKLLAVLLMALFHGFCARWRKEFLLFQRIHSERFFRFMNEVPTILMIVIVFAVLLKW
jgi:putative membrane protein